MNVFKRQLRLPSSFSGMKKAVSTSNLNDKKFSDLECSTHNLTLDNKQLKTKTLTMNTQDLSDTLTNLYKFMMERSNEDFLSDDLPISLSTEWLTTKYLTEKNMKMQKKTSAIIELLSTELNFLNQMQFLLDVSAKIFSNVQSKYFSYISSDDIFLNIGEIYEVNYQFWTKYLYPSFENAKQNDNFISCKSWKVGFNQMSSIFLPYQTYCSKMNQCQKYIQSLEKDKYFMQFLQWFSHTDQSNRESLTDFIAKPFQRLTKYKLLLSTIFGHSEDQEEKEDLTEMINSINLFLKQVEWKLSIAQIARRMDPIEFVEPPTEELGELCFSFRQIDLAAPINTADGEIMRQMLKEGTFKMKEAQIKIVEVSLIMFTDLILICQKIKNFEIDRIKVIRPIIPLSKLDVICPLPGSMVLRVVDDFGCLAAMYLLTSDQSNIGEWNEAIQNSQCSLKAILMPKHNTEYKLFPTLRVNIINPSPLAGRSPTPTGTTISGPSISPNFNRSSLNGSDYFSRSTFQSSPVIRRRMTTDATNSMIRPESFCGDNALLKLSIPMNRSISQQHYTNSQMSILEDDDDQNLSNINSSMSSFDLQSQELPLLSESNENLLYSNNDTFMNVNNKTRKTCDITFKLNDRRSEKLIEMRPYGSMMDLSMKS